MPSDTPRSVCFTNHVSKSPEERLQQMGSVQQIHSPGCLAAGEAGSGPGPLPPASPAPGRRLASSATSSRGSAPQTSSLKAGRLLPWGKH